MYITTPIIQMPCALAAEAHAPKQAFSTPRWFRDDWLNGFHDLRAVHPLARSNAETLDRASCRDQVHAPRPAKASLGDAAQFWEDLATSDYRFVYLGPAGSHTALHADVLRSFSWCGLSCCDHAGKARHAPHKHGTKSAAQ